MRLLLIAGFPGSILQFRGALMTALIHRGIEVHVAGPAFDSPEAAAEFLGAGPWRYHEIPLRRTGMNPVFDALLVVRICGLMRRLKPNVVLGYTIKPVIYGSIASVIAGVCAHYSLITGLGYAFQGGAERGILRWFVGRLYQVALRFNKKVFFQNPDDEQLFRSLGLLSVSVPSVVLNGSGVDVEAYPVAKLPCVPAFLMIARLLGDKGVREYVGAARLVKKLYPSIEFGLVGWIDDNPNAIDDRELEEWVVSGVIKYYGRLDDVKPAIEECSVYVLPSYREGTPRTVLEAMAMGRAIITTDAPGCRETVVVGENGFLVPIKAVEELGEVMLRFVVDPELAVRMGRRSRQIAEAKYNVHSVNAVMLEEMGI